MENNSEQFCFQDRICKTVFPVKILDRLEKNLNDTVLIVVLLGVQPEQKLDFWQYNGLRSA